MAFILATQLPIEKLGMYPLPELTNVIEAPVQRIEEACGMYFRSLLLREKGNVAGQHAHDHAHATLVAWGSARGWADGEWIGDKGCGEAFTIKAGVRHLFQSLEDETLLVCVHDIASAESVKRKGV